MNIFRLTLRYSAQFSSVIPWSPSILPLFFRLIPYSEECILLGRTWQHRGQVWPPSIRRSDPAGTRAAPFASSWRRRQVQEANVSLVPVFLLPPLCKNSSGKPLPTRLRKSRIGLPPYARKRHIFSTAVNQHRICSFPLFSESQTFLKASSDDIIQTLRIEIEKVSAEEFFSAFLFRLTALTSTREIRRSSSSAKIAKRSRCFLRAHRRSSVKRRRKKYEHVFAYVTGGAVAAKAVAGWVSGLWVN